MSDETKPALSGNSCDTALQVGWRMLPSSAADEWELVGGGIELPPDVQQRIKVIQQLWQRVEQNAMSKCSSKLPNGWESVCEA